MFFLFIFSCSGVGLEAEKIEEIPDLANMSEEEILEWAQRELEREEQRKKDGE